MNGVREIVLKLHDAALQGLLRIPEGARLLVIFAHGAGSSRLSRRNNEVAEALADRDIASLLFDLLTEAEDLDYRARFDIDLISRRMREATEWVVRQDFARDLACAYFGASTGSAAALRAAASLQSAGGEGGPSVRIASIVSRGGRPDLAMEVLPRIQAPTLLLVGGNDEPVIGLNRKAYEALRSGKRIEIIPGATHLFEEPGALEQVSRLAADWFLDHLP